jgi:mRNA-degrading endonuclease toxin of MazEF toxin-antitoxin module
MAKHHRRFSHNLAEPKAPWQRGQLPKGTANLKADSFVLCHQVFVIDKGKLATRIGELPPKNLKDVELALKTALYLR